MRSQLRHGLRVHVLLRAHFCLALSGDHPLASTPAAVEPPLSAGEAFITPEQVAGTYEVARRGRFAPPIVVRDR